MTAGEMMVRRAMERQRERAGTRLKVRMPAALWGRVTRCSQAVDKAAEEWVCSVLRAWLRGKFDGVGYDEKALLGTREGSLAVWVRVPEGFEKGMLRRALAAAAAWHEPRIPRCSPQPGTEAWVEGLDYVVEAGG